MFQLAAAPRWRPARLPVAIDIDGSTIGPPPPSIADEAAIPAAPTSRPAKPASELTPEIPSLWQLRLCLGSNDIPGRTFIAIGVFDLECP